MDAPTAQNNPEQPRTTQNNPEQLGATPIESLQEIHTEAKVMQEEAIDGIYQTATEIQRSTTGDPEDAAKLQELDLTSSSIRITCCLDFKSINRFFFEGSPKKDEKVII